MGVDLALALKGEWWTLIPQSSRRDEGTIEVLFFFYFLFGGGGILFGISTGDLI